MEEQWEEGREGGSKGACVQLLLQEGKILSGPDSDRVSRSSTQNDFCGGLQRSRRLESAHSSLFP